MNLQYDREFLEKLDKEKNKTIYSRITALNFEEQPIEFIEGRVTQGSINIDGTSAVRRTCSLTLVAKDFDYSDYLWGLNTKFKLEIGVKNNIEPLYPEIIWFNKGIYIITSFNTSQSTNNFTINIQGKDKMCMLNGDLGGVLESAVDFGTIETQSKEGIWTITKVPIVDIIRNMMHQYGGEPYHNIIINDLDTYGLELLEYRIENEPMYFYRKANEEVNKIYENVTLDGELQCLVEVDGKEISTTLNDIRIQHPEYFDLLVTPLDEEIAFVPKKIKIDDEEWYIATVSYGQTAGYRSTDLVYAGDLIANIGETITSVLDKIKNMLGEYEYFYDLMGRFVFQKKPAILESFWEPTSEEKFISENKEGQANSLNTAYTFNKGELITSFANNPNLLNVRNDYSIWGNRLSVDGKSQIPIHLRYAIDCKPKGYKSIEVEEDNEELLAYNKKFGTSVKGQKSTWYTLENVDWREIIYQMALDYYQYNFLEDFEYRLRQANPDICSTGKTGYEHYYIDLQGFWRELYNPNPPKREDFTNEAEFLENSENYEANYYIDGDRKYWNKNVYQYPEKLNFWFNFLDTEGELEQFSVKNIGIRAKVLNDSNIKAIYFRETPDTIFVTSSEDMGELTGFTYIQVPNLDTFFTISAQGKSAQNTLNELLYQYGYCSESATINCVPIYYLEPNTRIYLFDENTNLSGDYIINKITIPLSYNGTMSITATKAAADIIF